MKVLVACEFSGIVRDAFITAGHDAMSCDLLPTEVDGPHHQGDVLDILHDGWDLMVAHPPCTYLTNSGVSWLSRQPGRWKLMEEGAAFFRSLLEAPIPHVAVENPVMHGYARERVGRGPDQVIQPWMFGHMEQKATGLWLRGLPALYPTRVVRHEMWQLPVQQRQRSHYVPPGPDRWKERSRFFTGIARAMAEQWGDPPQTIWTAATGAGTAS